jgi:hypothetical protein
VPRTRNGPVTSGLSQTAPVSMAMNRPMRPAVANRASLAMLLQVPPPRPFHTPVPTTPRRMALPNKPLAALNCVAGLCSGRSCYCERTTPRDTAHTNGDLPGVRVPRAGICAACAQIRPRSTTIRLRTPFLLCSRLIQLESRSHLGFFLPLPLPPLFSPSFSSSG